MEDNKSRQIDVKEILALVLRRKWLIILPVIIITIVAAVGTRFLTPKYSSSTIVWIDKSSSVSRELLNIVGERRETREELQSRQLALETEITSKNFLIQLIQELKLDNDPEITRQAAKARESAPEFSLEQLKYNMLVDRLRKQISVTFHGYDQIKITVESASPILARDMADKLAEILARERAKYELERILDNQAFTDMQLEKTEYYYRLAVDSLNAAQARLSRLRLPENVTSEENQAAILSSIDKVNLEQIDLNRELESLIKSLRQFNLGEARLRYTDTMLDLRTAIDGLVSTYGEMMEKYEWSAQNVIDVNIRLNTQIRDLEHVIAQAVRTQFGAYPTNQQDLLTRYFVVQENLDISNSKERGLERPLDDLRQRMAMIPRLESEIAEFQSRVEEARRYRDAFRSEETTVGILSEQVKDRTKYHVIEPAALALVPVWPDKPKIILLGFVLGLALGGGFVFLTELLDNSFRRVDEVESVLGIEVLAAIPKVDELKVIR